MSVHFHPRRKGGWYVGGNFTYVGGVQHEYLAHIRQDHTVDPWNPSPGAFVQRLSHYGNRLYVGGYFVSMGGQTRFDARAELKEEPLCS